MMGAGKSTIGGLLAARRACPLIDLDQRVERISGRTIPELFAEGEPEFRAQERAALRSLLGEPGFCGSASVVATYPSPPSPARPSCTSRSIHGRRRNATTSWAC